MVDIGLIVAGVQSPLEVLIPVWFYVFSGLAYFAAAAISLAVCYFAFRISRTSGSRKFLFLSVSFLVLGIAFLALTASSMYTYFYQPYFRQLEIVGLNVFNRHMFNFYYVASLVSYLLLAFALFPKGAGKRLYVLYVPLWFSGFDDFHIAAIFLLLLTIYRAAYNFYKAKSANALLVLLAFSLMAVFHATMLLLPFDLTYFLVSHALLAAGFLSLLAMLIRVNKSGRQK